MTAIEPSHDTRTQSRVNMLAQSSLVPDAFKNKPNEIMVVGAGLNSLGVPLNVNTLKMTYVVGGKPGYMAQLQVALAHRHGHDIDVDPDEVTPESATVRFHREGWPVERWREVRFTMADAQRAGLPAKNPTYKTYPDRMLLARAVTKAIGLYAPELMLGLAGSVDADEYGRAVHPAHTPQVETVEQGAIGPTDTAAEVPAPAGMTEAVTVDRATGEIVDQQRWLPNEEPGDPGRPFDD